MKIKIEHSKLYKYSIREDIANSVTHAIGFVLSYIGMIYLISLTTDFKGLFSIAVFGTTMQMMFLSSTLYHGIFHHLTRSILKRVDHALIFVFILGTYFPFTFIGLDNSYAYFLLVMLTIICILGVIFKVFFVGKFQKTATLIYIMMGWIALLELKDMIEYIPESSLWYLFIGGVLYTVGGILYALAKFKYHHTIWHIFVLLGALSHFIAVYYLLGG